MKPCVPLLSYTAELFLEWEMFQTEVAEKIKTQFASLKNFFLKKSCHLWDNVENVIGSDRPHMAIQFGADKMRFSRRMTKAKYTHTHTHTHNAYCFISD